MNLQRTFKALGEISGVIWGGYDRTDNFDLLLIFRSKELRGPDHQTF